MKASRILLLGVAVVLPRLALATTPMPPQSVGIVDSLIDFCVKVDPTDAALFEAQRKLIMGGRPEHELGSVRGSPEYKNGFDRTRDALANVSPQTGAQTCAAGVRSGPQPKPVSSPKPERSSDDSGRGPNQRNSRRTD
jgi:hypothetical protein